MQNLQTQFTNVFGLFQTHVSGDSLSQQEFTSRDAAPGAQPQSLMRQDPKSWTISRNESRLFDLFQAQIRHKDVILKGNCNVIELSFIRGLEGEPIIILKLIYNVRKKGPIVIYDACTRYYGQHKFLELTKDLSSISMVPEVRQSMARIGSTISAWVKNNQTKISRHKLLEELREQQAIPA